VSKLFAAPTTGVAGRTVFWIFVGLFTGLAITGITTPLGPAVPVALVLALSGLAITLGSTWYGLFAVLFATVLLPVPFSVAVGPVTLSFGRFLLFSLALGWFAQRGRRDRPLALGRTPFDLPLLGLLGVMALSTLANLTRFEGFELSGAVRKVSLFGLDFALLFWITVSVLRDQARLFRFLRVVTGLIATTAGLGLVEFVTGKNVFEFVAPALPGGVGRFIQALADASVLSRGSISRVHSTFEQPLSFGVVLLVGLPLALCLRSIARDQRGTVGWSIATLTIGSAMLVTAGRSIYVVGGLSVLTLLVFLPDRKARRVVLSSSVLVVAAFLSQPDVRDTMIQFFQPSRGEGVFEGSVQARVSDYEPVLDRVNDRPLLGYGPRSFATDELKKNGLVTEEANFVLDNAYLGHLAETGVVGLLALFAFLATAWCAAWRAFRRAPTHELAVVSLGLFIVVQSWILMGFAADIYAFNAPPKLFFMMLAAVAVCRRLSGWPNDGRVAPADDVQPLAASPRLETT
jgi:O-antigen ligase